MIKMHFRGAFVTMLENFIIYMIDFDALEDDLKFFCKFEVQRSKVKVTIGPRSIT